MDANTKKALGKELKSLAAAQVAMQSFREKHRKIMEEYDKLQGDISAHQDSAKALVKSDPTWFPGTSGTHDVITKHGVKVTLQMREKVDGEALVALCPAVLRLAKKITITVGAEEVRRLVAAGVVPETVAKQCQKLEPAVIIATDIEAE